MKFDYVYENYLLHNAPKPFQYSLRNDQINIYVYFTKNHVNIDVKQ